MTDDQDDAPRGTWRHIRTAVVLIALLGLVAWAGWQGYRAFTEPTRSSRDTVSCTPNNPTAGKTLKPSLIKVRVYNATLTAGLATRVASDLSAQGFDVIEIANDPKNRSIAENALIVSSGEVKDRVRTLREYVPGARRGTDARDSKILDLVLGEAFDGLTVPPPTCKKGETPQAED